MKTRLKTWWTKVIVRGRGKRHRSVDREHNLFSLMRSKHKPTKNGRIYGGPPYYVIRWSSEEATWVGVWQNELEEMKRQGHVPPL